MTIRQMKCFCGKPARWVEMPPENTHRYRVCCPKCNKTVKWGGQAEFERLLEAGSDETVLSYVEQIKPKPDPFAQFEVK